MTTYRFIAAEHEEYGIMGWKPEWFPGGDPATGMGVAHDVLEHRPSKAGPFNEEMTALGAGLFVRGEGGYFSHKHPSVMYWHQNVTSDFPDLVRRFNDGTHDWAQLINPSIGSRPLEDWAEWELEHLVVGIRELIQEEQDGGSLEASDWMFDDLRMDQIIRLMRVGYRWAARRYRNAYAVCSMFQEIEKQADHELRYAQEGLSILHVRVDVSRLKTELWTSYVED